MSFSLRFSHFFHRLIRTLPWQVSLVVSIILFLIFHHLEEKVSQPSVDQQGLSYLLQGLKWGLPICGVILSMLSFLALRSAKTAAQHKQQRQSSQPQNSQAFEHLCAQFFRARGYRVTLLLADAHQAPALLSLTMGEESYLARYQYWQPAAHLSDMVTTLHTDMQRHRAKGGFLVVEDLPAHAAQVAKILAPEIQLIAVSEILQAVGEHNAC